MIYAQFFSMSTGYVKGSIPPKFDDAYKRPIKACGDRGVIIIDGRLSRDNMETIARNECLKRGFIGYQLFKGYSFTRSSAIGSYTEVKA